MKLRMHIPMDTAYVLGTDTCMAFAILRYDFMIPRHCFCSSFYRSVQSVDSSQDYVPNTYKTYVLNFQTATISKRAL